MRHSGLICILLMWGLALLSCGTQVERSERYRVRCTMHHDIVAGDSATLLVLDDDYGRLQVLGGARRVDSTYTFVGHIDTARLAMLRFGGDSTFATFRFVLEPTDIAIDLSSKQWTIAGGQCNRDYQLFLGRHARLQAERDSLWQRYVSMGTIDSTLTWDAERQMARTDSLLQDSLQRLVVERIKRGDLVARLVRQRLLPTLTRESLNQLR